MNSRKRRNGEPKYFVAPKEPIKVYPDGREVCDLKTAEGMREYRRRIAQMALRQKGVCCLKGYISGCPGKLSGDATFEHEIPKGSGGANRDDRIDLPDGTWINGAAHYVCNGLKGSRRMPYNVPNNIFK